MNKRAKIMVVKYVTYSLLMLVLYVLQSTPQLFSIAGIKPVLVFPFAVAVAMFDKQLAGGLFGLFAGILCDTSSNVLFGFQSILYLVICRAASCLFHAAFGRQQLDFYRMRTGVQTVFGIFLLLCDVGIRQQPLDPFGSDAAVVVVYFGGDTASVFGSSEDAPVF